MAVLHLTGSNHHGAQQQMQMTLAGPASWLQLQSLLLSLLAAALVAACSSSSTSSAAAAEAES